MISDAFGNSVADEREKVNLPKEEVFIFPASFAQQRLWFINQLLPGNALYNVPSALRLTGGLNLTALEETINEIVRRHEVLRTTFVMIEGQIVQAIAPTLTIPLPVVDLRSLQIEQREAEAKRLIIAESDRPFDLSAAPLLRSLLLQLDEREYILFLNMHHIVSDDWSMGVLIRELGALYTAFAQNQPSPLAELPLQYADFAAWQQQWLQGEVLETQVAYWRQQLDGISLLNLPTDRPKTAIQTYCGATKFLELSPGLSSALKRRSQQYGATLFMMLLAAFVTLLYRYTGQEDIAVGTPIANRNRSEIEGLIGFFVNSLVLRNHLDGNPTFRELICRVKEVTLAAYSHQDLPFEKLVEELQPERSLSRHPLFQVAIGLQNAPMEALELPGLTLSSLNFEIKTTRFDLEFHLWEASEGFRSFYGNQWEYSSGVRGIVVYKTDLFDEATITRMLGHFKRLLEAIVDNPEQRIDDFPILSENEFYQLLVEGNATKTDYPAERCIHQLFEASVSRSPQSIAVICEDKQVTYQDLNKRSNQLAHYLQKLGVGGEVLVGICLERSLDTIVGLLGILKAGGAYVPLDPTYPPDRLNFMLEDAGVSILLTHSSLASLFKGGCSDRQNDLSVVYLDANREIAEQREENPTSNVSADNLAYVMYTSGSTGKPKGVAVTHKAINRLVVNTNYVQLQASDKIAQVSNTSFDAATFEIWGALLNGAQLAIISTEVTLLPREFALKIRENDISVLFLTTALFQQIARDVPEAFAGLRYLLFGGETVDPRWVQKVLKKGPPKQLLHVYGPTENTTFSSYYCVQEGAESMASIPIGRPISNTQIYILDARMQPVPIGIAGELYVGGDGLARGYFNRSDLTAQRFIPNPFSDRDAKFGVSTLYKTGDLARYRNDGNIEFLGRIDEQVKIRGFRIELGEIEAVLNQHPSVGETVVITQEDIPGEKHAIAYIVASQDRAVTTSELRQFLKEKLPAYMIPSAFVVLESLPLTPNGKVDRRALKAREAIALTIEEDYIAPRTPIEEVLVRIWAELLGRKQVSVCDNFFELGGHSLLATQLISRVRDAFSVELPLRNLFEAPTVASLAKYIETVRWAAKGLDKNQTTRNQREEVEF